MRPPVVLARAGVPFPSHEGVHVTIPRRTDMASRESFALQHMKLLADLPHVGETPADVQPASLAFIAELAPSAIRNQASPATTSRKLKSSHPAFAEMADLPEEPPRSMGPRPTRFVDRAHLDQDWESEEDDFEANQRVSSSRKQVPQNRSHSRPKKQQAGWRPALSHAHAQVAPFSGLIVTAALMASAALLFWMMLGGQQPAAELNDFALPGDGFSVEATEADFLSTQAVSEPPLGESDFVAPPVQPEAMEYVQPTAPSEQSPLELEAQMSPTDNSAATMQPIIEQIDDTPAQLGQLVFPVTNTPLALDYSKAIKNAAVSLQELPAVAERADSTTNEPINR